MLPTCPHKFKPLLMVAIVIGAAAALLLASPSAYGEAHCYCKAIVYVGDDAGKSITNAIIDFGWVATYATQLGHDKDCAEKCSAVAAKNANFNNKTWLCQQVKRKGETRISAYSAVGTRNYQVAQSIFTNCSGNDRTCMCPKAWLATHTNVDGGVTVDGTCKKVVCQPVGIPPYAPDGTPIGTWGFTWGNAILAWGTVANGGAANCVTTPWVGK